MIIFNISETTRASNFKMYRNVSLDSLYISTGNDVTIYFRQAANHTNVSVLGHVRVAILDNDSTDFEKVYCFENNGSSASFDVL